MSKTVQPDLKVAHDATIAHLTEITDDPIDAMRLAADLFAMSAYRATRAQAIAAGVPSPRAPKPLSKYMRIFTTNLKVKANAIAGTFSVDELDRLKKLGPVLAGRLERNDPDLAEEVYKLMTMAPDDAVAWIRDHLDEIEARFAS